MTVSGADMGFRLEATFVNFEAVLALHGEVDLGSAAEFGAYLDWAIDQGHRCQRRLNFDPLATAEN
jgi:hypothetical protein